jgi:hypothetical protein
MPCAYNTTHMDVGSNGSGESVVTVFINRALILLPPNTSRLQHFTDWATEPFSTTDAIVIRPLVFPFIQTSIYRYHAAQSCRGKHLKSRRKWPSTKNAIGRQIVIRMMSIGMRRMKSGGPRLVTMVSVSILSIYHRCKRRDHSLASVNNSPVKAGSRSTLPSEPSTPVSSRLAESIQERLNLRSGGARKCLYN